MAFRSRQKQRPTVYDSSRPLDAERVYASQLTGAAVIAAVVALIAMNALWLATAMLTGKVFPWFSILQGIVIGLAVRRRGRGFEWRFSLLAAAVAFLAAYTGGIVIAAEVAARDLGTNVFVVIFRMSEWTLGTYADEMLTPADHIFAVYAAILAAYFARRKLNRAEVFAIRTTSRDNATNEQQN